MFIICLPLNTQTVDSQEVNRTCYLSHDGGGKRALVVHPAIHTGLRVQLTCVGEGPIQVKELPLGMDEATAFLWLQVWVQWDGDSQEGILAEDPSAVSRDSVIVEDVDPAAVTRDGCREVLQWNMRVHQEVGETKENHLKDLESSQASNLFQEVLKGHQGWTGDPQWKAKWLFRTIQREKGLHSLRHTKRVLILTPLLPQWAPLHLYQDHWSWFSKLFGDQVGSRFL